MPDKIAVITGFSRGIGRSVALHLGRQGVGVIGTYQTNAQAAEQVVGEIASAGGTAVASALDVEDSASFPAFRDRISDTLTATFGTDRFDYLVNNAGGGVRAPIAETTEEQFDKMINQHVKAPFFLTQALLPLIADGGSIINESSCFVRIAGPGYAAYSAAKGAVEVLTRSMAVEFGERGIRVNTVSPGAIATDFESGAVRDNQQLNETVASITALGRVGEPDDVGAAVSAILSDDFRWANGSRIELSGGQRL